MSFISIEYIVFLAVVVAVYYIVPKKFKAISLLLASYAFYYMSSSYLTVFIAISTLSIYLGALCIRRLDKKYKIKAETLDKQEKKELKNKNKTIKKVILLLIIIINFGILAVFKYSGFAIRNLNHLIIIFGKTKLAIPNFILPLGISYYTLMAVSYIVDVYRGKYEAEKNIVKVALYLSFFPQVIEGPIAKFDETSQKLYEHHKFDINNIINGLYLIIIGMFKKLVIADRAGIYVNNIFGTETTGLLMFFGGIMYTLQIYAEFSGCMDIVLGSAKMLGIALPENFKRPFFSRSIQEFWRRWHITLGAWIKEYIFYPVSLSKMNLNVGNFFRKHLPKSMAKFLVVAFPLLFVWLYNGIWHGASWKYIAYGMYYYVLILIGILLQPALEKLRKKLKINTEKIWFKIYEMVRTTFFVVIGMMMFRSHSFKTFVESFLNIFKGSNASIWDFGLGSLDYIILGIYVIVLIFVGMYQEKKKVFFELLNRKHVLLRYAFYMVVLLFIAIFGIYGKGYDTSSFIYGQF